MSNGPESPMDRTSRGFHAAGRYEDDPLYDDAVKIVHEKRMPSISVVQRHLAIGYNRAARLLEEMERRGVLSPLARDGTRKILDVTARVERSQEPKT